MQEIEGLTMAKLFSNIESSTIDLDLNKSDIITIILEHDLEINYHFENGHYKVLIFNDAKKAISLKEKGQIINSDVEINYLELNSYDFKHENILEVNSYSNLKINSIYLGFNNKDISFYLINKEHDSKIDIQNRVVCLNSADLKMKIIGKIFKKATKSKCHQRSNCLTFGEPSNCKIEPILLIDENDVEASHSLSCGTISDDVLFYMNSRGLDKKASLILLLQSYLIPNDDFYLEFVDGLKIKELCKKKVMDICK